MQEGATIHLTRMEAMVVVQSSPGRQGSWKKVKFIESNKLNSYQCDVGVKRTPWAILMSLYKRWTSETMLPQTQVLMASNCLLTKSKVFSKWSKEGAEKSHINNSRVGKDLLREQDLNPEQDSKTLVYKFMGRKYRSWKAHQFCWYKGSIWKVKSDK